MISVQTVVPLQLRPFGRRVASYRTQGVDSFAVKEGAKGTPTERFHQYRLMGQIQATVIAMRSLNGNGKVSVFVRDGSSHISAELNHPDDESRFVAIGALNEVTKLAQTLTTRYPQASFEFRWVINTTFSDIRVA